MCVCVCVCLKQNEMLFYTNVLFIHSQRRHTKGIIIIIIIIIIIVFIK